MERKKLELKREACCQQWLKWQYGLCAHTAFSRDRWRSLKKKNKSSKKENMYKYEFVRIKLKSGFLKTKPAEDYQEIINSYAKKGWRFKQIFGMIYKS